MPLAKYTGLNYPTHILKSRGSVIRNNFIEYRTNKSTIWHDVMFIHYSLQILQNIYSIGIFRFPIVTNAHQVLFQQKPNHQIVIEF